MKIEIFHCLKLENYNKPINYGGEHQTVEASFIHYDKLIIMNILIFNNVTALLKYFQVWLLFLITLLFLFQEPIYSSTDISLLLKEVHAAQETISKIQDMRQGMMGNALVSIMDEVQ